MSATTAKCFAGYVCRGGASSGADEECPAGSFCPEGSFEPQPCPASTFSNTLRLESAGNCTLCTPGQYCESGGNTAPDGDCSAGFYCPLGSATSTAVPCPVGSFCETGEASPRTCPAGSFSNQTQLSACFTCPAGSLCTGGADVQPCPAGFFCLEGSGPTASPCPA